MIVCLCHGLSEASVREAIRAGARTLEALEERLGAGADCGTCVPTLVAILEDELAAAATGDGCPERAPDAG